MARLAIDGDFLDDYSKLPKPVQGRVKAAIDKFAEHVHAGLHLEKISHSRDDRIRTIRIDQFWRGVVLAPDAGDTYSLIRVIEGRELDSLWAAAVAEAGLAFAPTFLNREWEQVILAQDLGTELDYLIASRAGQGTPLGRPQRRQVWALAQRVESRLRALGRDTFTQLANEAARALRDGAVRLPYRHVIIDEAQDLHPAQWRLLRAAVPAGPKTKRSSRTGACFTRTAK